MSTFTTPLKRVISATGGTAEIGPDGIRRLVGGNIGLEYYPIFNEDYRPILTGKIVDHYWNREIGLESIEMFQLAMRRKMNEIMPYYNQLYESTRIQFDPLSTVDVKTLSTANGTQTATGEAESSSNNESTSGSRTVQSETPQTMLSGNADYATAAADANSKTVAEGVATETNTSSATNENTGESHTSGYQGIASELLMRYRESIINVDFMVIRELEECFMLVWDNGDQYITESWF